MKIIVNGKEEPSPPGEAVFLEDIFNHFLSQDSHKGCLISRTLVNGKELPIDSKITLKTPADQIQTLEIEIAPLGQIVNRNLANAQDYLQKLVPGVARAADLFRLGNEQEANQYFLNIIDGMGWFSQVVLTISQAIGLDYESDLFEGRSLQDRFEHLTDLTKQLLEANKNKDWVLVADLMEYEIHPFYAEWVDLLPQITRFKSEKFN